MKSIRELAATQGLSRTALLYYDRIGLLKPEYRTSSGRRLYSPADEERLARICRLRDAGLPLRDIEAVLEPNRSLRTPLARALNKRLTELNREIATLRKQQQVIVALMRRKAAGKRARLMNKERWIELLAAAGFDREDRNRWHVEFEKLSPEAHQDFLESLGISAPEIRIIRRQAGG
jgi:MerR family transcriptional regulator, thiopeptide resistance regulator